MKKLQGVVQGSGKKKLVCEVSSIGEIRVIRTKGGEGDPRGEGCVGNRREK